MEEKVYYYKSYGKIIKSEIEISEFIVNDYVNDDNVDIVVKQGSMPEKIKNLEMKFDRISKDYSVFKKHINFEYEMINEKMDIDFKVEYKDKVFTDLKEYGDFIIRLSDMNKEKNSIPIGKMMGFEFILDYNVGNGWNLCFKGANN